MSCIRERSDGTSHIRIHRDQGIVGAVASQHDVLCISDAYSDSRFNPATDLKTGYKTTSILALPIFDPQHNLVGVLQLLNKTTGTFGDGDVSLMQSFASQVGDTIYNILKMEEMRAENSGITKSHETDGNALTGDGEKHQIKESQLLKQKSSVDRASELVEMTRTLSSQHDVSSYFKTSCKTHSDC